MRLRQELRLVVGTVMLLQVITLVAAVGLLSRMTPAVKKILAENDFTIQAAQEMLTAMADRGPIDGRRATFAAALVEAEQNITEPEEAPLLETVSARWEAALEGDPVATGEVIAALDQLAEVNRESMRRADAEAQRLGMTGAWASVLLALVGSLAAFLLFRRLDRRMRGPVEELRASVQASRAGDVHRRCQVGRDVPREFRELSEEINAILAENEVDRSQTWDAMAARDRKLLLAILDRRDDPVFVLDDEGRVVLANRVGAECLLEDLELNAALKRLVVVPDERNPSPAATGDPPATWVPEVAETADLGDGLRLIVLVGATDGSGELQLSAEPAR